MLIALLAWIDVQSGSIRGGHRSHSFRGVLYDFDNTLKPCGSWLASDGDLTDNYNPQPVQTKNKE